MLDKMLLYPAIFSMFCFFFHDQYIYIITFIISFFFFSYISIWGQLCELPLLSLKLYLIPHNPIQASVSNNKSRSSFNSSDVTYRDGVR